MYNNTEIKPIVKWAGGKSQLLNEIIYYFPEYIHKQDFCLIEPFVGGGAVSFWALSNLPNLKKLVINDYNADLTNLYQVIRDSPKLFLEEVQKLQVMYDNLTTLEEKKPVYYHDNFFDELYSGFNIQRIQANRAISAKSSGRINVSELLISNVEPKLKKL